MGSVSWDFIEIVISEQIEDIEDIFFFFHRSPHSHSAQIGISVCGGVVEQSSIKMIKACIAIITVALSPSTSCAFAPTRTRGVVSTTSSALPAMPFFADDTAGGGSSSDNGKIAVVAGASGYIGKSTVRESVRQGYKTIALVRDKSKVENEQGQALYGTFFEGAEVVECDVCDADKLTETLKEISSRGNGNIEAVISCLASREY